MVGVYTIRSKQELDAEAKRLERASRSLLKSPKKSKAFLIKAGILDKKGGLAKRYR